MSPIDDYVSLAMGPAFASWPIAAAIALGLVLPASVVGLSSVSTKWPDHLKLTVIFASIVIGSSFFVAFSGRTIVREADLANPNLLAAMSLDHGSYWPSRIAHLILLSVSITEIFMWIIRKREMGESQFTLWVAVMIYYVISVFISGATGHFGEFNLNLLYAPIVFTAVALLASSAYRKTLQTLRWILFIPLGGSLIGIWVAPHLVLQTGYASLIPGFSYRLFGLTNHANSLGIIAAIALFLELSKFVCPKPNSFLLMVSIANLVLAQSKTAWIIAILGVVFLRSDEIWRGRPQNSKQGSSLAILSAVFFITSIAALLVYMKMDSLRDFLQFDRTGLITFTGRTRIWEITWNEFLSNPLLGYGPEIWNTAYRSQYGIMSAGHAHNQYVQVLGQAGLLGAFSLAFYIILLIRKSYQGWNETHGLSLLIVASLLIQGFAESPMRMMGIMDSDGFIHLLSFLTVASVTVQARKGSNLQVTSL